MAFAVDLHSHSSYAGGAGKIDLKAVADTMKLKGIDVFGVGDCLFPAWQKEYSSQLKSQSNNLLSINGYQAFFIRQTEVIFTVKLDNYSHKIIAHHIILFPDDESVSKTINLLKKYSVKNTIARPFIVCESVSELQDCLSSILSINPLIELIPAHILTPDGILGSKNGLVSWNEFYGELTKNINAVETGLSADPEMLCQIPDLQGKTFISNSDCHSSALNRVGREFTILDSNTISYEAIIESIRTNAVALTSEFPPSEGRYYLTGHRGDRHHNGKSIVFNGNEPCDMICPTCGKKLVQGVRDRALALSDLSIPKVYKPYKHLLPLIDVIAYAGKCKNVDNQRIRKLYFDCISVFETEIRLWQSSDNIIQELLDNKLPQEIIKHIIAVKNGNLCFEPAGYDGCYGILNIHLESAHEC